MITLARLREVLNYWPFTGIFTWKVNRGGVKIGDVAGCIVRYKMRFYRRINTDGKRYYAHRLAWLWMTGKMPPEGLDVAHDDQNGLNNAWSNLYLLRQTRRHYRPESSRETIRVPSPSWFIAKFTTPTMQL